MADQILNRVDTAARYTLANPVLGLGEYGVEQDTGRIKVGDGLTQWVDLDYFDQIAPMYLKEYTVAQANLLPVTVGANVYISDETDGAVPAFYDGTSWRRFTDRAIIS